MLIRSALLHDRQNWSVIRRTCDAKYVVQYRPMIRQRHSFCPINKLHFYVKVILLTYYLKSL